MAEWLEGLRPGVGRRSRKWGSKYWIPFILNWLTEDSMVKQTGKKRISASFLHGKNLTAVKLGKFYPGNPARSFHRKASEKARFRLPPG